MQMSATWHRGQGHKPNRFRPPGPLGPRPEVLWRPVLAPGPQDVSKMKSLVPHAHGPAPSNGIRSHSHDGAHRDAKSLLALI